jgi:CRISPR/Cas system-associated exonuclease Cas4 (RecB family)
MKKNSLLKLSASSIKTFEQCPRKYYYNYIERRPRKSWPHLDLGNFVHEVLEKFHIQAIDKPRGDWPGIMTKACEKALPSFHLIPDHQVRAQDMLGTYLAMIGENGMPPVLANEQAFKITWEEDNIMLRGYIDRIDKDESGYRILDYKSGKSKYLDEFQLLVYGLYLISTDDEVEKFKGTYLMLGEKSKEISYTFTKTDLERCANKIKHIAKQIRGEKTWEPKPQFLCSYCDFEEVCPATAERRKAQWKQKSTYKRSDA